MHENSTPAASPEPGVTKATRSADAASHSTSSSSPARKPKQGAGSEHITVATNQDRVEIRVAPAIGAAIVDELARTFEKALKETPPGTRWTVDLSDVRTADLRLLDILVALGRNVRRHSGSLAIKGLWAPSSLSVFVDLFERRCKEQHIDLEWGADEACA